MKNQAAFSVAAVAAFTVLCCAAAVRPAAAQVAGFSDVPAGHWAAPGITKLAQAGVINGYSAAPLAAGQAKKPAAGAKAAYDGNKPVTRYELAIILYRYAQYMEQANKQKKTSTGAMIQPKTGAEAVKLLIAGGYLPKTTPLSVQGDKAVTANQFADALGLVLAKVKEKTTPISPDSRMDIARPTESGT